jgi:GIY-YIG catalytic domain
MNSLRPILSPEWPCTLYRHFDLGGKLLYVGIAIDALGRLAAHKSGSGWYPEIATITLQHFQTRIEAMEAERRAILTENPLYNTAMTGKVAKRGRWVVVQSVLPQFDGRHL